MLDLYKLHIFTIVAQEGSFSAAAEHLYMTQSAVSQHIKELEASLGQTLFQRGWRGVRLTAKGDILLRYARDIFALIAEAENAVAAVDNLTGGRMSIGATPGIGVYRVPEWVQSFRSSYPQLSVSIQTGVTAQIIGDVLAQRLDIGFIEGELDHFPQPRLSAHVLEEVEQYAVVSAAHPFWNRDSIRLDELNGQAFIMRPPNSQSRIWLDEVMHRYRVTLTIMAEYDNLESIKRAVAAGACLTILPAYVVQPEVHQGVLRAVRIEGQPLKRSLKLIWDREVHFSPITRAFLDSLTEQFPALRAAIDH